jgi:ABC-2 type transport system permease protein
MLTWLRVAWAFFVRDFRIEASYKVGFVLSMLGVILNLAIYYFITRIFGSVAAPYLQRYGGSYFAFVVLGVAFSDYLAVGIGATSRSLRSAQVTGTLELMLLSPTRLPLLLLSSSLWSYAFATLNVLGYLLLGFALGMRLEQANVPLALLSLALAIVSFTALGVLAASLVILIKYGNPLGWAIRVSSLVLGGVFYPVEVLPEWLRWVGQALPLTHALELLRRSLLLGESLAQLWGHLLALTLLSVVLLPMSLLACSLAIGMARMHGSLSQY